MARNINKESVTAYVPMDSRVINPTSFDVSVLTNKELIDKVSIIAAEGIKVNKTAAVSGLKVAAVYHDIVSKELFNDDFTSLDNFAKFMGISPSNLSNMVNAASFVKMHGKEYENGALSVSKACILRTAEKKEHRKLFQDWLSENGLELKMMTDAQFKQAWSDYKGLVPALESKKGKKKNSADTADTSDTASAIDNTLEGGEKVVTIQYGKKVFSVPVKAWKAFMKENGVK